MTLSVEQKKLAEERVAAAGFEGVIRVHLMDYREIPAEWEGAFDAFISIEMIEVCSRLGLARAISDAANSMSGQNTTTRTSSSSTSL